MTNVAIVDDDESVRRALGSFLRSAGLHIQVFASAEEFLRMADLDSLRCLILDWRMPGMDGLQLQKHLADNGYRIPIILLTAHGDETARAQALKAGAVAFLPKPFDTEALLQAVSATLDRG